MYGFGYAGYPVYCCPNYSNNNDGFGASWIWIIIIVVILFFLFNRSDRHGY